MKDLVIYERDTRIILAIITDYEENYERKLILNKYLATEIVDANSDYIIADDLTGTIKFKNPKSNILYMEDYRACSIDYT